MNAYKSYKNRQVNASRNRIIEEHADEYIEHMDLVILMVLHDEFGFGARRLERFYRCIDKMFREYKKYLSDKDKTSFFDKDKREERDDTWTLKRDLKKIGFDYDKIVEDIVNEGE